MSRGRDSGSGGGASSCAQPGPELFSRRRRSSSPLCAPRSRPCAFTTRRFLHQLLMRLDDPFGFDYAAAMHRDVFADDPAEAEAGAEAGGGAGGMGDPELSDPLAAPQERLRQPLSPAPSFVSWACAVPGDGTAVAAVDG